MTDLLSALALVLVIEGVIYAAFPEAMQRMMTFALQLPPANLRTGGLAMAVLGVFLAWLIRG